MKFAQLIQIILCTQKNLEIYNCLFLLTRNTILSKNLILEYNSNSTTILLY